jgi:8-oxo-dGTP diphosphatase
MDQKDQNPDFGSQKVGRNYGVVVGIPRPDGRWLMIRRGKNLKLAPLKVCFPGGMMELNETEQEAIVREMHEELGVRVRPIQRIWNWDFPDRPLTLFGWLATLTGEPILQPDPHEIAEILWLTAQEGAAHSDGLSTNVHFIAALTKAMSPDMIKAIDRGIRHPPDLAD